jgi:hypothetical protein
MIASLFEHKYLNNSFYTFFKILLKSSKSETDDCYILLNFQETTKLNTYKEFVM